MHCGRASLGYKVFTNGSKCLPLELGPLKFDYYECQIKNKLGCINSCYCLEYFSKQGKITQRTEVICSSDMSENLSIREKINLLSDDYVISDIDFQDFVRGKISFVVEKRESAFTDKVWYTVRPHRINYNLKQLFNGTTENKTDVHPSDCGN